MIKALTRHVPASFANALSAVPPPVPIDVELAREQHAAYGHALEACGATVKVLSAPDEFPDCVFIEDTAVIAGGRALVTRPGAPSRRGETRAVGHALRGMGPTIYTMFRENETLDGGDCMVVGDTIFVGRSARTNAAGIARLVEVFEPADFVIVPVDMPPNVLHLKCVTSPLSRDTILLADASIPASVFVGLRIIRVPVEETYAANAVAIDNHVIVADGFPRTIEAIERAGFTTHPVPTSEVRKADGSLTCQSLLIPD